MTRTATLARHTVVTFRLHISWCSLTLLTTTMRRHKPDTNDAEDKVYPPLDGRAHSEHARQAEVCSHNSSESMYRQHECGEHNRIVTNALRSASLVITVHTHIIFNLFDNLLPCHLYVVYTHSAYSVCV